MLPLDKLRQYFPESTGLSDTALVQLAKNLDAFLDQILDDYLELNDIEDAIYTKDNHENQH